MTSAALVDSLILTIQGQKVLLDADLATIYGVATKVLNQAVKRNADRFPEDFRFQLTEIEKREVVTNCDHLSRLKFSKTLPYAFTEHGALMAAKLLKHDDVLRVIWQELQPLLAPPPEPPKKELGFHVRENSASYRAKSKRKMKA